MKILVLNGPNLNLLGIREPAIYGKRSYADLVDYIGRCAEEFELEAEVRQSNHEGVLVDWIQEAMGCYDALVINAAAYTHTSIALLDALKAVGLQAAEVHLSDVDSREPFRRISYVGMACEARFVGKGFESYREALEYLAEHVKPVRP